MPCAPIRRGDPGQFGGASWRRHEENGALAPNPEPNPLIRLEGERIPSESISRPDEQEERGYLRGASTISQQTVKNLFLWPGRSFVRKGLEAWFAIIAELCLSKRRILEIYLNIAEFGPGVYGIRAASRYFFGRTPAELSDREAALLAAVLPNPGRLRANDPSDYVHECRTWILTHMRRMEREGWITRITR